jgi:hypothetical protein
MVYKYDFKNYCEISDSLDDEYEDDSLLVSCTETVRCNTTEDCHI